MKSERPVYSSPGESELSRNLTLSVRFANWEFVAAYPVMVPRPFNILEFGPRMFFIGNRHVDNVASCCASGSAIGRGMAWFEPGIVSDSRLAAIYELSAMKQQDSAYIRTGDFSGMRLQNRERILRYRKY